MTGMREDGGGRLTGHLGVALQRVGQTLAALTLLAGTELIGCGQATDESQVLVFVNGRPITHSEFEYRWSQLPESTRVHYSREGGKRKFLDDLILRELLLQEARKRGLDQSPALLERLERTKEQLVLDDLMKEALQTQVELSNDELEAYYASHADELLGGEQVRAAHIVVATIEQARDLKHQLEQGADFAKLAQHFSLDQATKSRGGDLGPSRRGALEPEVQAAVRALRPGMVSDPVKTKAGFHLIKLLGREHGDAQTPQLARERLRQELYAEKRRQQFETFLSKLKASAAIRMAEASRYVTEDAGSLSGAATP